MAHPLVYGAAVALGVVVCLYTFFRQRQSENNYEEGRHRPPPPPPPYEYPRKENEQKKTRRPENDDSQTWNTRNEPSKTANARRSDRHRSPPPPYKEKETDCNSVPSVNPDSTIRQRRPQNDTSGNEAGHGFQGSPHYLHENIPSNGNLVVEADSITDANPASVPESNSGPSFDPDTRQRRPENNTIGNEAGNRSTVRSPHYLHENIASNGNLVDEPNSITDANLESVPERTDSPVSSATSRSFDILSDNESLVSRQSNHQGHDAGSSVSLQSGHTVLSRSNNTNTSAFVPLDPESLVDSRSFDILQDEVSIENSGSFENYIIICAMCNHPIAQENPTETVPCKHFFHFQCITDHLKRSKGCPWCKINVNSLNF